MQRFVAAYLALAGISDIRAKDVLSAIRRAADVLERETQA
jgi:hypothetical protein